MQSSQSLHNTKINIETNARLTGLKSNIRQLKLELDDMKLKYKELKSSMDQQASSDKKRFDELTSFVRKLELVYNNGLTTSTQSSVNDIYDSTNTIDPHPFDV